MNDIRWKQRFANFDRAFVLLREAVEQGVDALPQLSKEGAIQRFEFAFELAWKTLKDYLEDQGVAIKEASPRNVIKIAHGAGYLDDAQIWIDMLVRRNLLSHTYNFDTFDMTLKELESRFYPAFERLHDYFLNRLVQP